MEAIAVAKAQGIDVLIDAILNVSSMLRIGDPHPDGVSQHKLGADRRETFTAVPVDPQNRLKALGLAREIEVTLCS